MKHPLIASARAIPRDVVKEVRAEVEASLNHSITELLAKAVADGREYVIKLFPVDIVEGDAEKEPSLLRSDSVRIERNVVIVLLNWTDCEMGEFCIMQSVQREQIIFQRDGGPQYEFKKTAYRNFAMWQRVG